MDSLARLQQAACLLLQGPTEDWAEIPLCAGGTGCPGEGPSQSVGKLPNWCTEGPRLCSLCKGDTFPYLQKAPCMLTAWELDCN